LPAAFASSLGLLSAADASKIQTKTSAGRVTRSYSTDQELPPELKKLQIRDNVYGTMDTVAVAATKRRGNATRKPLLASHIRQEYNNQGKHVATGKDVCDCLKPKCPGCHFPCPKCASLKCGPTCRVNRKFLYQNFTIDGDTYVKKNRLLKKMGVVV